jgi:hypothetical protein
MAKVECRPRPPGVYSSKAKGNDGGTSTLAVWDPLSNDAETLIRLVRQHWSVADTMKPMQLFKNPSFETFQKYGLKVFRDQLKRVKNSLRPTMSGQGTTFWAGDVFPFVSDIALLLSLNLLNETQVL